MDKIDWKKILDLDETLVNRNRQHSDRRNSYGLISKEQKKKIDNEKRCAYESTSKEWTPVTGKINENAISLDYSSCTDDDADSGLFLSFDTDTFLESNSSQLLSSADELIFWSQAQTSSSTENSPENCTLPVSPEMHQIDVDHAKWSDRRDNRVENVSYIVPPVRQMNQNTPTAMLYQQPSDIPQSVLTLVTNIKSQFSDHAVVYAIAAQMCETVLPMDAYVSLKIALLLSLISIQSSTDVPPISIMAVGADSSSVFKIMNGIGECAQKFILPSNDLRNTKTKYNKAPEPNSLLIARKGVCYIGDWLGHQPATAHFIRKVLDSGRIPVENSSIGEPLQCSVWSYWSCYTKNMRKNVNDLSTFLSVFGIPITMEENESDSIVDYLLEMAITGHPPEPDMDLHIETEDMQKFLRFIGSQRVEMSKEAENLLKSYFLATRSLRPEIISQRAYLILRQFAESYARLCMRKVILKGDAIASIVIAENYILGIFGSEMSSAPPRVSITNIEQVDRYMQSFETWLYSYISNYMDAELQI